jgi:hypothetical protein
MHPVAFLMSVIVHEFVHVESPPGRGEGEAYTFQLKFLELAYKKGFITEEEYKAARSQLDSSVSDHLEGKGGGKDQAEVCGGCLKYDALNPLGFWRSLSAPSQFDTVRTH